MLRRASRAGGPLGHTTALGMLCGRASFPSSDASLSASSSPTAALSTTRRLFLPSGTPGKEFLRHLTTPSEPTKAFSPLETLRPPAPPSAADAQPFGSLNRTNQLRRYVNVNTAAADADGANTASGNPVSSSGDDNTLAQPQPQQRPMELSKLLRRHPPVPASAPAVVSAPSNTAATTAPSSSAAAAAIQKDADAAVSRQPMRTSPMHATVARAQAAIAAAQQQQQLQEQKKKNEREAAARAAGGSTVSPRRNPTGSAAARAHADDANGSARQHVQVYKEHCTIGWSPEEFYRVVADVEHYTDFLPWCAGSTVHTTRRVRVPRGRRLLAGNLPSLHAATTAAATPSTPSATDASGTPFPTGSDAASSTADAVAAAEAELVDAIAMTATLTIGFSFLKEQYTSRVTLYPGTKIVAALYDDAADAEPATSPRPAHHDSFVVSLFKKAASTAGAAAKRSILKHLLCEWEFCPVPGKPNAVEVVFSVSFEFKNPLHGHMIMSNVVTLMTRSFERRCENLYGPPSTSKESLPLFH